MIGLISLIIDILTWIVFIYAILTFFLSPYHPIRQTLGRIVDPMLNPIRRYVSPAGGVDFSPIILILLFQVIGIVLSNLLR